MDRRLFIKGAAGALMGLAAGDMGSAAAIPRTNDNKSADYADRLQEILLKG